MKVYMHDLAENLHKQGFTWKDIDSEKINNAVIEYLANEGLFDKLYEELVDLKTETSEE